MILVADLRKITCCPNCGNSDLEGWYNINTQKHSKYCAKCKEEMFEKEPDLCVVGVDLADEPVSIDTSIRDLEYEISDLTRLASSPNELMQLEKIRDIFYEMLDIIKELR